MRMIIDPLDRPSWKQFGIVGCDNELIYRLYDVDSVLLYVGITWNPFNRWTLHARTKSWWLEVASADVRHCRTVREARAQETAAIHTEGPRYNIHQVKVCV